MLVYVRNKEGQIIRANLSNTQSFMIDNRPTLVIGGKEKITAAEAKRKGIIVICNSEDTYNSCKKSGYDMLIDPITAARLKKGYTLEDVSKITNIEKKTLTNMISPISKPNPKLKYILQLSEGLEIKLEELISFFSQKIK